VTSDFLVPERQKTMDKLHLEYRQRPAYQRKKVAAYSPKYTVYGDVIIAGEGLQNIGLCSALRAFEQVGVFIVPHLL
jgi:hypothetical protein